MNKELCDKLNALPVEDREKYKKERDSTFNDFVYAARHYNMSKDEYNNLSDETRNKFELIIYTKLFGKIDISDISSAGDAN
jgi:hypothetical protein